MRISRSLSQNGLRVFEGEGALAIEYRSFMLLVFAVIFSAATVVLILSVFLRTPDLGTGILVFAFLAASILLWMQPSHLLILIERDSATVTHVTHGLRGTRQKEIPFSTIVDVKIIQGVSDKPAANYYLAIVTTSEQIHVTNQMFSRQRRKYWNRLRSAMRSVIGRPQNDSR